jgi:hypothetical protein
VKPHPVALVFRRAFERLEAKEAELVAAEVEAYCRGYLDERAVMWEQLLGVEMEQAQDRAARETLVNLMNEAGVVYGTSGPVS